MRTYISTALQRAWSPASYLVPTGRIGMTVFDILLSYSGLSGSLVRAELTNRRKFNNEFWDIHTPEHKLEVRQYPETNSL